MSLIKIFDALGRIESTSGRNAKVAILEDLIKDHACREGLAQIVLYTMNPFFTYRVSSVDTVGMTPIFDVMMGDENLSKSWFFIRSVLDKLRERTVDLAAGRQQLNQMIGMLPEVYAVWFKRIVARDLKIGIASWDKWFKGMIPDVNPMLCNPWNGEIHGMYYAEPKLDGLRAVGIVNEKSEVIWVSRNGKELYNTSMIDNEIAALGLTNMVLDGEFAADTFGESMSITKTMTPHPKQSKLRLQLFDLLTLDEWNNRKCDVTTRERKGRIMDAFGDNTTDSKIVQVPYYMVHSQEEVNLALDTHVSAGYEGTVLKDINAYYEFNRSDSWQKVKPTETADLTIYGIEEGSNRNEGSTGALKVRGVATYKGKQYEIDTKVGTGLKDTDRAHFWSLAQAGQLEGRTVEVKFQDVTVANLSSGTGRPSDVYALRFPVFIREREDKAGVL